MENEEDDRLTRVLTDELLELGLTDYEAHTLVALVRLGTGTAKAIADADGVPRTRVYDAVETLHEMGLVDVQYTTPREFTVISRESIVRNLNLARRNRIDRVAELLDELDTREPETQQFGTWTVTGRETVAQRVVEFVEEADEEVVYLTVDELLTDEHLDALGEANERGLDVYVGGVSEPVAARIREAAPSAVAFETLWEWSDTPAGSLLVTDRQTALVSVRVGHADTRPGAVDEVAIWGSGDGNGLVVVLRAIFTWRLETYERTRGSNDDPR
jgi:sugar-specific transcriptional regulator TrmB